MLFSPPIRPSCRARGYSLIEMCVVLALCGFLLQLQTGTLQGVVHAVRLEVASTKVWSALQYARSEALYSGQDVLLCALHMRVNHRLQGCLSSGTGATARDWPGVLLFADRAASLSVAGQRRPERDEGFDRLEDLRDYVLPPGVAMQSRAGGYALAPDGSARAVRAPVWTLRDRVSQRCRQLALPLAPAPVTWCQGAGCPGCTP